ncbi:MAG: peptidyl-prolyl cis-trans isomerase [Polyangiaceae bacterium]|nr:peptidyl-prolyl cis-trans isomerase [Polyangiaceae bacterium]
MRYLFGALCLAAALLSCGEPGSGASGAASAPASSAAAAGAKAVARVNGVPIAESELDLKLKTESHEAAPGTQTKKNVLEQLVTREVLAQKALSMGLDKDPRYLEGLQRLEAQVALYKRQQLSDLLLEKEGGKRSAVTEDDAKAYYQKFEKRIKTQMHVYQILRRSESAIVEARSAIDRGKSFEEVAKDLFPGLPESQKPWDLGYLSFSKIPEPWREQLYDMKPGEMSGILRGPNDRFWLVKLIDVREDPSVTFESAKEAILADLKATRVQATRGDLEKELRGDAKVEILLP